MEYDKIQYYITTYPEMATDLASGYSWDECQSKEYHIPNIGMKCPGRSTIYQVSKAIRALEELEDGEEQLQELIQEAQEARQKKKGFKKTASSLAGVDQQRMDEATQGTGQPDNTGGNPHTPYLPENAQLSSTEVQALVENATLRNENRHLQEKLDELRSEKTKLEQSGLAGINLNQDHKFLQRDYTTLKEKYEEIKAKYKDADKEREKLKQESEWEEKLARIASIPGMENVIRNLGDKLIGGGAPQMQQLSGTPEDMAQAQYDAMSDEQKYAFSYGVFAMENLTDDELKEIFKLIQVVGQDKSQMVKVRNFINKMVEDFRKKANNLEEKDDRGRQAQSI